MTRTATPGLALGLLIAAGCTSSAPALTGATFASQYCDLMMPCCAQGQLATDGGFCRALLGAAAGTGFDASSAATCLAAMRAAEGTPALCAGTTSPLPACDRIFPSARGTARPGEPCTQLADCALSAAGTVECFQAIDGGSGAATSTCVVLQAGQAGQGPCLESTSGGFATNLWSPADGPTPASGYTCDRAAGLACWADRACHPLAALGQACAGDSECQVGAACDLVTSTCTLRGGVGAPCLVDGACVDADYCDFLADTCAARVAMGAPCTANEACPIAAACTAGTCQPTPDLGLVFLCGSAG